MLFGFKGGKKQDLPHAAAIPRRIHGRLGCSCSHREYLWPLGSESPQGFSVDQQGNLHELWWSVHV